ncbi:FAD-binding and (Fe-S)-binding domain-containing protein [Arsenicicoccus cauae]|uniref:FAD-binding and (Fe-S)-binding domain-containing protein n=1 Tax=Arsenicicoccus cauae TaxID=2663847 RepID=UPI00370D7C0A
MTVTTSALDRSVGTITSRRLVDRVSKAHDASHYLLTPQAVVTARTVDDVARTLAAARADGVPVTFRSGGTSLSGQALSDGILLDTRTHFRGVEVLDGGERVRCRPGATLRSVNAHLARYRRRLGPDPASEIACTVGGVVANNSSGMQCGTELNTYRTLDSLVLVLPSGTVVDTSLPDADEFLRRAEPELWEGLAGLRDRVRADPDSTARIAHQYSMKNTMGYGVNAFVDFDEPVRILEHLVVGSEGTLGWVAEVTFRTVPISPYAATALLVVDEIGQATDALGDLVGAGAKALELLDAASLRVVQRYREASPELAGLDVDRHAALLVEATTDDSAELDRRIGELDDVVASLGLPHRATFTRDARERADLWHLRKGLYTSVAGARPQGTTNLLEDIAVPLASLSATVADLTESFRRHGYDDAVTFGHAKDGNLHFMINPRLDDPAALETYEAFTEEMVSLVLGHEGTLKAEHGTGRIMAPYVRRQFGDELYAVMQEVKRLADPSGVLNPGTLLDDDPGAHLRHLKTMPAVDPAVDRCVECGYCEPVCPSRDLTTTPRRRITLLRDLGRLPEDQAAELRAAYDYEAVDTCAVDSLCVKACPVGIDTGLFMKSLRADRHSARTQRAGIRLAEGWGTTMTMLRTALAVADTVPGPLKTGATSALRRVISPDVVPLVGDDLPGRGPRRPAPQHPTGAAFVYFSSCLGSLFAPSADSTGAGVVDAFFALTRRAGLEAVVPDELQGLCCGTPWVSKGLTQGADAMSRKVFRALWRATEQGRLPVVCDAASCTHGLADLAHHLPEEDAERWGRVRVIDAVTYVAREVLPHVEVGEPLGTVAVHPTCSTVHLGVVNDLVACAQAAAREVVVPVDWGCCGFAGDRGMLHPELTASATRLEAHELDGRAFDAYVSANRACELGMSRATGRPYRHVLEVLAERVPGCR